MKTTLPIEIRNSQESDWPYIVTSWSRSYQADKRRDKLRNKKVQQHFDILKTQDDCVMRVAVLQGSSIIVGYLVTEPPVLHYVYVKKEYRKNGIAGLLLDSLGMKSSIPCTYWTKDAKQISEAKPNLFRRL